MKAEKEKLEKLEVYKKKIEEGENLVRMGIISQQELDQVKEECAKFEKSLNDEIEQEIEKDSNKDDKEG